jgi:hypothetical protein
MLRHRGPTHSWEMFSVKPRYFLNITVVSKGGVLQHPSTFHTDIRNSAACWRPASVICRVASPNLICKVWLILVGFLFQVSPQIRYTFRTMECDGHSPLLIICSSGTPHRIEFLCYFFQCIVLLKILLINSQYNCSVLEHTMGWMSQIQRMLTADWSQNKHVVFHRNARHVSFYCGSLFVLWHDWCLVTRIWMCGFYLWECAWISDDTIFSLYYIR